MAKFKIGDIVRMDYNTGSQERYIVLEVLELVPSKVFNGKVLDTKGYVSVRVGSTLLQSEDNYELILTPVVEVMGDFFTALTKLERKYGNSQVSV